VTSAKLAGRPSAVSEFSSEAKTVRAKNVALYADNEALWQRNTRLKVENQLLDDTIARLNNLPPRPPFCTLGMEKLADES
jgi:hypothetical protein